MIGQRVNVFIRHREARGRRVPAVPHKQVGARVQRLGHVEFLDAPRRAFRLAVANARHRCRSIEFLAQPRCRQADHAGAETLVRGEQKRRHVVFIGHCQVASLRRDLLGQFLPLAVLLFELPGQFVRFPHIVRHQQFVRGQRRLESACCIQPRAE